MRNNKKTLSLLLVILAVAGVAFRSHAWTIITTQGNDDAPAADVSAPAPKDVRERAKRQARNKRYDNSGLVVEPKAAGGDIVRRSESFRKMSALPVGQSDAVVIGQVTDAQSYLSEDKSGVYTEFTVQVNDILKHGGSLMPSAPLVAQREGGRVRFASGLVQRYRIDQQELPRAGRRYVLFLRKADGGEVYTILTGYELRGGRVHPLDGLATSGVTGLPQFARYEDADEAAFLAEVRDAIAKS